MKIAINTRLLLKNKMEGIGWFSYEVLKRITVNNPTVEFYFLFDRPFDQSFIFSDNVTPIVVSPQARHPVLFYWWFEQRLPKVLKELDVDLFFSPDGYLSLKTRVPSVAVIHDLNFEHYPEHLPWIIKKYYQYYFPKFAQKATRIATVSKFSKQDIIKQYGVDENKINVVHNGASRLYQPLTEEFKLNKQKDYSKGKPYFVYVGSINPRKNVERLLLAFNKLNEKHNSEFELLLVGEAMWGNSAIEELYNSLSQKECIQFTGRLNQQELANVIGSALAMVYVSIFEGFGIPVLEAMQSGVPVITSNVTSMPEVAGEAGILVNPLNVNEITEGMELLALDGNLREKLIKKGLLQAKKFSWDNTAKAVWETLEQAISDSHA